MNQVKWQFQWHTEAETKSILVCHLGRLIGTCNSDYTWSISKVLRYSMHCQGISQFYLHTLHFICKWNELYLPFPSQPQLVLIYRPGRNGRLCCEVTPAKIRTCNLPITSPVLNHTATATTLCLKIRVRTIPRSIPNTQYYWPPVIPIPNTDTEYDIIRPTHQCHKFISTGQCYSQSLSPPIRRMDSLRYATSVVGALFTKGRKRWLVILFYRTYDLLSWTATQVCVRGGGRGRRACGRAGDRASLQSPLSLCHHAAPARAATHEDPCQEPEHGRATYAAALADRRRCTPHEDTTLLHGYLQQIYCSYLR